MRRIGFTLSTEEYTPAELIEQARLAEDAGFDAIGVSDHFHPWIDEQGESPFVWSLIGAVSQVCDLPVVTAVTCPTVRTHPAIIAHAAATSAVMLGEGRFILGVGSGEALNEHILGTVWPNAEVRLEMLEEAIEIIRLLWTGEVVSHRGRHYTLDTARIYTLPETPPAVYMSAFGPKALDLAGRVADGFITTSPDAEGVKTFRDAKGGSAPTHGQYKVTWATDRDTAIERAHRLWPTSGVPGELSQVLPSPQHFEQAASLVTREKIAETGAFGNDVQEHIETFKPFAEAGFDDIYIANIGPDWREMIEAYGKEILPELRAQFAS